MFKLPEEPGELIYYAIILLPGFVVLGLILHLTGNDLSEFAFTYIAIAMSVAIYGTASIAPRMVRRIASWARRSTARVQPPAETTSARAFFVSLTVVSLIFLQLAVMAIKSNGAIELMRRWMPFPTERLSAADPLLHIVRDESNLHETLDRRPLRLRANQSLAKDGSCDKAKYSLWVRVKIDGTDYEGRVGLVNERRGTNGLPLLLSPACKVIPAGGAPERFELIPGPGVLVMDPEIKVLEFREMFSSGCWKTLYPDSRPTLCPKP